MTDTHMRLLAWLLGEHEGASLMTAVEGLGVPLADVERLARELVDAGILEREPIH